MKTETIKRNLDNLKRRRVMDKQKQILIDALKLIEENPEMEIHVAASCDDLSDDYGWMDMQLTSVAKSLFYQADEHIYTDVDDIIEHIERSEDRGITGDEAIAMAKEVILIHTNPKE